MAGILPGASLHSVIVKSSSYAHAKLVKNDLIGASWYLSRKDIEENSPSRRDGIDIKRESYLRKSYCTFLQDLGMRLKVPQVTIATAIVFCHRFFLRQSHGKNDHRIISTACMFLAGKVEESPKPLKDVILVSYEIIHKKGPAAIQRIRQKAVYKPQKELILLAERVVLTTLGFDLNVQHPYKCLVDAIKKFKASQISLAKTEDHSSKKKESLVQVAWNFVNDGLRTSLCLQYKSHQIAAGAIFLAAKFLEEKLPSDGDEVWWQQFNVTPKQLKEISKQMLELYKQNHGMAPSKLNETEASFASAVVTHQTLSKNSSTVEEPSSREESHEYTKNDRNGSKYETVTSSQVRDKTYSSPLDATRKINKDKFKAALERRKEQGEVSRKMDVLDDDDLIERELESGIELSARGEMVKKLETNHDIENIVEEGRLHSSQEPLGGKRKSAYDNNCYRESMPTMHRYGSTNERDLKRQRQT